MFMAVIGVLVEIVDYNEMVVQVCLEQSAAFLPQWPYCGLLFRLFPYIIAIVIKLVMQTDLVK